MHVTAIQTADPHLDFQERFPGLAWHQCISAIRRRIKETLCAGRWFDVQPINRRRVATYSFGFSIIVMCEQPLKILS